MSSSKRKVKELSFSAAAKSQKRLQGEQRRLKALEAKRQRFKLQARSGSASAIGAIQIHAVANRSKIMFSDSDDDEEGQRVAAEPLSVTLATKEGDSNNSNASLRNPTTKLTSQLVLKKVRKKWMGSDSESDNEGDADKGHHSKNSRADRTQKLTEQNKILALGSDSDSNNDIDSDEEDLSRRFRVRPQFEGAQGKRLMDLQRRIADPRFEFDARFAADYVPGGDLFAKHQDADNAKKLADEGDDQAEQTSVETENTHALALLGSLFTGIENPAAPARPDDDTDVYGSTGDHSRHSTDAGRHLFGKLVPQARFDPAQFEATQKSRAKTAQNAEINSDQMKTPAVEEDPVDTSDKNAENPISVNRSDKKVRAKRKASVFSGVATAVEAVTAAPEDNALQHGFKVKSGWSSLFSTAKGHSSKSESDSAFANQSGDGEGRSSSSVSVPLQVVAVTREELERGGKSTTEEQREAHVRAHGAEQVAFSFNFDVDDSIGLDNAGSSSRNKSSKSSLVAAFDGEAGAGDRNDNSDPVGYTQKYRDILDYGYVL